MSENIIPDKVQEVSEKIRETVSDAVENAAEAVAGAAGDAVDAVEDLSDKTLAELSDLFVSIKSASDSMLRSKEAEAVKSAFYKLLSKLKGEAGLAAQAEGSKDNPFEAVEQNFKAMYADYKKERAEFNRQQEAQREENLAKKQQIIADLKALVEGQEDVSSQFPAFRELQNRWREAGPVPAKSFRDINDTYQFYVEKFYDMVQINRDLRDLDFRRNLEAKEAFCEAAEKLAEDENIVSAFHELQKLHEQWKEYGPVAKEKREEIWNRFKAATSVINKKYQAHFETLKKQHEENLEKKRALCEKLEEIAGREISSSAEWNALSKEIEELQAEWRKIGFATKKENQRIYDRFRAACDKFFGRKREFYASIKENMSENLARKQAIIEQAEALKTSTEWKKATDQFISLQKQWKEIGAVPRKKSEQLWKRFRAACDEFFANSLRQPQGQAQARRGGEGIRAFAGRDRQRGADARLQRALELDRTRTLQGEGRRARRVQGRDAGEVPPVRKAEAPARRPSCRAHPQGHADSQVQRAPAGHSNLREQHRILRRIEEQLSSHRADARAHRAGKGRAQGTRDADP